MNDPIIEILKKIEPWPAMFLGRPSLTNLAGFLEGYICCYRTFMLNNAEEISSAYWSFREHVRGLYPSGNRFVWESLLDACENDEFRALNKFYELLDSYLNPDPDEMSKYWHDRRFIPPLPRDHKLSEPWCESLEKPETVEISYEAKDKIRNHYVDDCILSEEVAAEIAKTIFISAYGEKYNPVLPIVVRFDAKSEIWLVFSHAPNSEEETYFTILMRKKNAEIIAIWETTVQTE